MKEILGKFGIIFGKNGAEDVEGIVTDVRIGKRVSDGFEDVIWDTPSHPLPDYIEIDGVQAHPSRVLIDD